MSGPARAALVVLTLTLALAAWRPVSGAIKARQRSLMDRDAYSKIVDDKGRGLPPLSGVRSLRPVLFGIYYRGGANNSPAAGAARDNRNPLQDWALDQLCAQGFTDVVYLYERNFATAKKSIDCATEGGKSRNLVYQSMVPTLASKKRSESDVERQVLSVIHAHLTGRRGGRLYMHCWNGWHASGFVASLALRQFCGWSSADAERYFIETAENTANAADQYKILKQRIRAFAPLADLSIDDPRRADVCPVPR